MGFMDKAKRMADQAQKKLDETQRQFNEGQSQKVTTGPKGTARYDKFSRPIHEPGSASQAADAAPIPGGDPDIPATKPPAGHPASGTPEGTSDAPVSSAGEHLVMGDSGAPPNVQVGADELEEQPRVQPAREPSRTRPPSEPAPVSPPRDPTPMSPAGGPAHVPPADDPAVAQAVSQPQPPEPPEAAIVEEPVPPPAPPKEGMNANPDPFKPIQ